MVKFQKKKYIVFFYGRGGGGADQSVKIFFNEGFPYIK